MILQQYWDGILCRTEAGAADFTSAYDVIVVGLGTAGAVAAIAAARRGLRVLGLERMPAMGGQGTLGYVLPYYFGGRGGLYEELDRKTRQRMEQGFVETNGLHPDCKLFVLEQEAEKAGAEIRCEAALTGVYLEGKSVVGIQWLQAGQLSSARARVVLDCTGEAAVCVLSGCETRVGRESDGKCQPFSHPMTTFYQGKLCCQFVDSGVFSDPDPEEYSRALVETMTGSMYLRDPFEPIDRVVSYSPSLGIREGRRIVGEENLRLRDYLTDNLPREPLFYAYANLDKHGDDYGQESLEMQEWSYIGGLWGINLAIPVPLGALIPKGYDGLLAVGRHLAVDHDMASAVRMKRDMQKCGEAAALAAAEAVFRGCSLREVDYGRLRPLLEESGCLEREPVKMKRALFRDDERNPAVEWLTDPQAIREGLVSGEPGLALLSCRRLGTRGAELLRRWNREEDPELRTNCVLGMGLLGLPEALPGLRELAFFHKENGKRGEWAACSALCLLRRLGGVEELPELKKLIRCGSASLRPYAAAAVRSIRCRISCQKAGDCDEMASQPVD